MKMLLLLLALTVGLRLPSSAEPYFTPVGPGHYHTGLGALFDPAGDPVKETQIGTELALLMHKADPDNSMLPAFLAQSGFAETWAVAAGFANGAGRNSLTVGPTFNIMGWMKAPVYKLLERNTEAENYKGLKAIFNPNPSGYDDAAAGPMFVIEPIHNGVILPINKWTGRFKMWAGKSWVF